jgi:SAM-dependent methyltransferase
MPDIQSAGELDAHYSTEDPWGYDTSNDDHIRRERLLSFLPQREFGRSLDIGCGNGFLTFSLPGSTVVGCDVSPQAIEWATQRAQAKPDRNRFELRALSLFDLPRASLGRFDLIVITGVLYPQYIGKAFSLVQLIVDDLLNEGGILVSVHIDDWCRHWFPYTSLDMSFYSYREYTHRLEVYRKCS